MKKATIVLMVALTLGCETTREVKYVGCEKVEYGIWTKKQGNYCCVIATDGSVQSVAPVVAEAIKAGDLYRAHWSGCYSPR